MEILNNMLYNVFLNVTVGQGTFFKFENIEACLIYLKLFKLRTSNK